MVELDIRPAGDAAAVATLGDRIDVAVNERVHALARRLRAALAAYSRVEIIPSYAALLVRYDPGILDHDTVVGALRTAAAQPSDGGCAPARRRFLIPVAYGGEFGPDLEALSAAHGLEPREVIARHADRDYPIYGLGFSPGFPFLGGLDPSLHTPRLETPRSRVPRGSVAIGGEQTGVYPTATPGGWHLIGRTPLILFDIRRSPPVPYGPGDVLRFRPIDAEEYERVQEDARMPEPESLEEG